MVDPPRVAVLVGDRGEWQNVSIREHTITSRDALFDSDRLGPNGRFSYTFAGGGSFGDGTFRARLSADASARYRAVVAASASAPVHVEVVPARTLAVSAARGRRRQLVRVAVSPALPGGTVHLQRYLKERFGWWTIRRARLGRGSRATIGLQRGSKARVRVVLTQPDGETSVAVSQTVKLPG